MRGIFYGIISVLVLTSIPGHAQDKTYRVGIIGLVHGHAWGNIRTISTMANVKLVGIAEPNTVVHKYAKEAAPDAPLYTSMEKLLSVGKPEIVWAFVENNRHLDIVKICAPLGIHVIFEKPLSSTLANAREIRKLARQYNIHVLTNYQMAWWPTSYAAHQAAQQGRTGEVWRVHGIVGHGGPGGGRSMKLDPAENRSALFYEWLNDEEKNGGGAIMDFGCYGAVWANWYLGKPQSVWAMTNHRKPDVYDVDDNAVIICQYDRGVAVLEGSWSLPRSFQDVEIFGATGSVTATRAVAELTVGRRNAVPAVLEAQALPPERSSAVAYIIHSIEQKSDLEGMVALDLNVDVVEILEAARMSVKSGEKVILPLP